MPKSPVQVPKADLLPPSEQPRYEVIVKFTDDVRARLTEDGGIVSRAGLDTLEVQVLIRQHGLSFSSPFAMSNEELGALEQRAAQVSGKAQPDLAGMLRLDSEALPEGDLIKIAVALQQLSEVEFVSIRTLGAPPPADIPPATPLLLGNQDYRFPDPGMNVDFAAQEGLSGDGIRFSDCEFAWTATHEDLEDIDLHLEPMQTVHPDSIAMGFDDHGTAVVGVTSGVQNSYGVTGTAPGSEVHTYPEVSVEEGGRRLAAIMNAIADSAKGDIVLLEMQTVLGEPVEVDQAIWTIIKTGTDAGVVIVEAAGNGNIDLDSMPYEVYRTWGDSGAIVVGAGTSDAAHNKVVASTYGSRVDIQSWGENVFTLGYGDFEEYGGDKNQRYTDNFRNTSAAAALVAGATLLLQEEATRLLAGDRFSPRRIRRILERTGRPQGDPQNGQIGTFVDLEAAILNARVLNDDFDYREDLESDSGSLVTDSIYATVEEGEPLHAGQPIRASVWWEWTAPYSGEVTFDTHGSDFDTVLAVYTPIAGIPEFSTIVEVVSNDDPGTTEEVSFQASGNITYQIAVASPVIGPPGNVTLNWAQSLGSADLRVEIVDSPDPASLTSEVMLTATATNLGPDSATSLQFVFELPPQLEYLSSTPAGACEETPDNILCSFPSLGVSEIQGVTITATAIAPGIVTTWVGVLATETHPAPENSEATESTTIVSPDPADCGGFEAVPTLSSTTSGGFWSQPTTWASGRVPEPSDVVEINGPVYFRGEPEVAGLVVASEGWLWGDNFFGSASLHVAGNMVNHGEIRNQQSNGSFRIEVAGNAWNTGSLENGSGLLWLSVGGCIANSGLWKSLSTVLTDDDSRSLLGNKIYGDTRVEGNITLDAVTELSKLSLVSGSLTIPAGVHLVTDSLVGDGGLSGEGIVSAGSVAGVVSGNLSELRITRAGGVNAQITVPLVVLSGVGRYGFTYSQFNVINGTLVTNPGVELTAANLDGGLLTVNGRLIHGGATVCRQAPVGCAPFNITVNGDVENNGVFENGSGVIRLSVNGNIVNSGTWDSGLDLTGSGPRTISGSVPLRGFTVTGNIELVNDVTITGGLGVTGTLTVNSPQLLQAASLSGGSNSFINGSGAIHLSSIAGSVSGDIAEVRLVGSGSVSGTVSLPNLILAAPTTSFGNGTIVTGGFRVLPGTFWKGQDAVLTVNGSVTNGGILTNVRVPNGPRTFTVHVNGPLVNTGQVQHDGALRVHTYGNIVNNGTWLPTLTYLEGTTPRTITGASPLLGPSVIVGDFELLDSAKLAGAQIATGGRLSLAAPHQLTVESLVSAGTVDGSGTAVVGEGGFQGSLSGSLAALRFEESTRIDGILDISSVIFSFGASQVEEVIVSGDVSVASGATVQNWQPSQAGHFVIEGMMTNEGVVTSRATGSAAFDVEIHGDFENRGDVLERANLFLAADVFNLGTRSGNGSNFLTWDEVVGSTYEIAFSENQVLWTNPVSLVTNQYEISGPLSSTFYWRNRVIDGQGNPQSWSAVHALNEGVVAVTIPDTPLTYYPGSTETLGWSAPFPSSDQMILAMKRDSVPPEVPNPDGVNWFRFTTDTPNDGSEVVTIPEGVAFASDWRFYVRHVESGAYDGSDFTFTVAAPSADLVVSISDAPDPISVGGQVTYSIDISNDGPQDATDVTVINSLLGSATSFVSTNQPGICNESAGVVACAIGVLSSGSSFPTIEVTVTADEEGTVISAVDVSGAEQDPDPLNNTAQADTVVLPLADLSVTKVDSVDPVVAGEPLSYTITVDNAGPSTAQDVVAAETLPADVTFVTTSGCAEDPGGVPSCTLGSIATGGNQSYAVTVDVNAGASGVLNNQVCVSSAIQDPDASNDCATEPTTVLHESDLSISLSDAPDPVVVGENVILTASATNLGPSDASAVEVVVVLPAELSFVEATPAGACSNSGGTVTCDLGTLASGDTFAASVTALATAEGLFTTTVSVSGGEPDPVPGNNSTAETTEAIILSNVIFTDGFETGNTSAWSTTVP